MTRKITIYGKPDCSYCDRAKRLLDAYGWKYSYLTINVDYTRDDLVAVVGDTPKLTVPQIVINGKLIGGFTDLAEYMDQRVGHADSFR